ncbi:MAG: DUF2341 domain-containing protein [Gemmatimonadota bacterium]|nr:MAG: DUF2341 domain-containing protein [Gemmatimonadota bacterium]
MEDRFGSQVSSAAVGGEGRAPGERVPRRSGSLGLKRITLALAAGVSLLTLPGAALGQGWYDPDWGYRKKITIDNTMVAGDLTNFPVLLDFTDTDLRDKARNDGWDILFTEDNGTTKLDHDFEDYDGSTGAIIVWVEVTNLSGSVDTDIYMYYGYATVPSNQENETGTWGNGYEAVYHLHNNSFADATGNHTATNSGSANATGIAGDGRNFLRSEDDYIDTGWNPSLTGDFSFEGWFRALGQSGSGDVWGVEDRGGGDNSEIRLAIRDTDANNSADGYNLEIKADAAGDISDEGPLPGDPDDGNWHHIALVREGSTGRLYYDGSYITLNDSLTTSGTAGFPVSLLMGAQWDTDGGGPPAVRNRLNGDLDETRVSTVLRTGDYFATQVANVNNSAPGGFYDFLSGEELTGLIGHWNFNEGSGQVAADASPSNNDGTLGPTAGVESGDPTWTCSGTALEFDGIDDEVKLSNVTIGDRAAWSISAWIKMGPDAADKRTIYGEGDTTQREYLYLDVAEAGSYVTFYSEDSPGSVYTELNGTTNVEDDTWHLVTVVQRSKTDRVLYVDGTPEDSSTQNAGTLVFNTASIGYLRSEGWVADPFLGTIDDVRIYDYALSTAEIATLNANPPGACGAAAGDVVMMVVANAATRDLVDDSLAAYLQTQGLTVVFADDDDTRATYDSIVAADGVDVIYVSPTSGSAAIGTKLYDIGTGLVMSNRGNWDNFELSANDNEDSGTTTEIVDNTHFITQPFSTGLLTINSVSDFRGWGSGGFGAGAQLLAQYPSDPTRAMILVYEAGALLQNGQPAVARRVGMYVETETWSNYTADTKTLIYRSILWGGGLAGAPGGDAVTSAVAEISPNDVTTNDTGIEFIYAILATIGGTDTGVDRVTITVPNSFGLPTVDSVRVGGTAVTYTNNTAARLTSFDLDTKLASTDSIQVYFTADAPTAPDATGQDFTSTVDDSGTGAAAQSTTEGSADGDAGDNNDWTVTTTDSGGSGPTPPGGICPAADIVSTGSTITNEMKIQHTTSAGPDRLMLVGVSINNDDSADTVISVTYNGAGLSRIGTVQNADDARVEIWQLVNPPALSDTVTITFGKDLLRSAVAGVITFAGADQTPIADFYGDFADGTTSSVTVTSAAGEMVFALMSGETTGVPTLQNSPPAIERWNLLEAGAPPEEYGAAATDSGAAPNVTVSWTHGNDHWAAGGVSIVPAAACLNAAPSISSAADQTFQVGDPTTAASTIIIAEDTLYQTITDTTDLRVRIPAGLDMIWDTLQATIVVGGNASSKVSTTVSYEDAGKTAVIDVTTSFAALDTITVDSLKFMDFGSVSAADSLELEVKNDGLVSAVDDKTKEITAASSPTILGRYCFNEAAADSSPSQVLDDQANPLHLGITYNGMSWTELSGNRGLGAATHSGIASADAAGSKYPTNLDGALQATLVAVTEWTGGNGDRVAGFVESDGTRIFFLLTNDAPGIELRMQTQSRNIRAVWFGPWDDGTRRVFHAVYDAPNATQTKRIRLYVDGADQGEPDQWVAGTWPDQTEGLDFSPATVRVISLNEPALSNPLPGHVFYFAVHDAAFTDSDASSSATALLVDDDCGAVGTPAVTSATAEIEPNDVATGSTANEFVYAILATISGSATGVDSVAITVPATFGDPTVDSVRVGGTAVTYTDNTAGRLISIVLDTKVSSTDSIQVYFAADAPGSADPTGQDFTSAVDDTSTSELPQTTTEGNADGDAGDNNSWTVTTTDASGATLLGRYWFNEAPSGQTPTTVYDDQPSPVNLTTIVYDTPVEWTVVNDHRGLNGASDPHSGIAYGTASGTKYTTNLDGALEAAFVAVAEWAPAAGSQRIAGFVRSGGARVAELVPASVGGLSIRIMTQAQSITARWPSVASDSTRRVFHIVYDADHPVDSLRIRLYVNGSLMPAPTLDSGTWPDPTDGLDFSAADILLTAVNNTPGDATNPLNGTVFYYAVYAGALTDSEISTNATALLADDDNITPSVAVTPDGLGAPILRQAGTDYSYEFVVENTSSVLDDYDLLASTDPASSFVSVDSITFNGLSFTSPPDSALLVGLAAGVFDTITVWYTVASDTDGNVDTLYLAGRSVTEAAAIDSGYVEIEYDVPVAGTPLVRYWIDEAPSGQGVANLIDSESNPISMPLTYVDSIPYFAGDHGGYRHLRFNGPDNTDTGGGLVDVGGTKMDGVHGSTVVTIEAKYAFEPGSACTGQDERIFGISEDRGSAYGQLQVRGISGAHTLSVMWAGVGTVYRYGLTGGCNLTSASVVHWVVDTNEATDSDRVRAYVGGVRQTVTVQTGAWPSAGATIDLGAVGTRKMYVGRPYSGLATMKGRIWYVALYLGEMSDAQIASNASALASSDDTNTYAATVTPDGASVMRLAGTDYSYAFTLNNGSSVLEDFDLLASTDPASSFITIDSITGGGISDSGVADSTRIYGVDASADSTVTVWYTVAADTDGNIDTLYLRGRSISDTAQSDLGWIQIEYETMAFTVAPDGADTLQLMPTGTAASSSYKFTITNNSALSETFDLLAFDGAVLTVDSITGPNVSGGSPGDSARTGAIAASAEDSAFVWFTISVGTAGALDSLYLMGRSVGDPSATDSGWVFVELLQPDLVTSKVANPNGTQPPGTDLTYTLTITNNGTADGVNVVTVDSLAAEVYFQVGSVVTTLPGGMTDSIEYYDGCGSDGWSYTPVSGGGGAPAGYDACAVRIRWTLLNDFSYVAPNNTADLEFVARIK